MSQGARSDGAHGRSSDDAEQKSESNVPPSSSASSSSSAAASSSGSLASNFRSRIAMSGPSRAAAFFRRDRRRSQDVNGSSANGAGPRRLSLFESHLERTDPVDHSGGGSGSGPVDIETFPFQLIDSSAAEAKLPSSSSGSGTAACASSTHPPHHRSPGASSPKAPVASMNGGGRRPSRGHHHIPSSNGLSHAFSSSSSPAADEVKQADVSFSRSPARSASPPAPRPGGSSRHDPSRRNSHQQHNGTSSSGRRTSGRERARTSSSEMAAARATHPPAGSSAGGTSNAPPVSSRDHRRARKPGYKRQRASDRDHRSYNGSSFGGGGGGGSGAVAMHGRSRDRDRDRHPRRGIGRHSAGGHADGRSSASASAKSRKRISAKGGDPKEIFGAFIGSKDGPEYRPQSYDSHSNPIRQRGIFQSITAMADYAGKSFEEIRLEDYTGKPNPNIQGSADTALPFSTMSQERVLAQDWRFPDSMAAMGEQFQFTDLCLVTDHASSHGDDAAVGLMKGVDSLAPLAMDDDVKAEGYSLWSDAKSRVDFPVHRCMLMARCPKLLQVGTEVPSPEKKSDSLDDDEDDDGRMRMKVPVSNVHLALMLEYIYTQQVAQFSARVVSDRLPSSALVDLAEVCERFALTGLLEMCLRQLRMNILNCTYALSRLHPVTKSTKSTDSFKNPPRVVEVTAQQEAGFGGGWRAPFEAFRNFQDSLPWPRSNAAAASSTSSPSVSFEDSGSGSGSGWAYPAAAMLSVSAPPSSDVNKGAAPDGSKGALERAPSLMFRTLPGPPPDLRKIAREACSEDLYWNPGWLLALAAKRNIESLMTLCKNLIKRQFVHNNEVTEHLKDVSPGVLIDILKLDSSTIPYGDYHYECDSSRFADDMEQLFEKTLSLPVEESGADFSILVGNVQIHAHKAILAAQSNFFRMLYQNKMADQNTMVLSQKPLPSVDSQKAFLRFLYCGKINLCAQSAMELLECSQFYELTSNVLESACIGVMIEQVSAKNFITYLISARNVVDATLFDELVYEAISHRPGCLRKIEEIQSPEMLRSVIYAIASHQRDPGLHLKKRKTVQPFSDADTGAAPSAPSAAAKTPLAPGGVGVASASPGTGAANGTSSSREESSDDTTDTDGADADPFSESGGTGGDADGGGADLGGTGAGTTTILAEANSALANVDNWFIDL